MQLSIKMERVLMLDLKAGKEVDPKGVIQERHTFYVNDINSSLVFHAKGAHTWRSKLITLAMALRRCLRYIDQSHSQGEVLDIIRKV